jgi:O-antigen/teichoic acid export membrane protein
MDQFQDLGQPESEKPVRPFRFLSTFQSLLSSGLVIAIAQIFMMAYAIVAARWLSPEAYGVMAACYAAATLFSFFLNWGIDTWLLRQGALDIAPARLLGNVVLFKLALGVVWTLVLWLLLRIFQPDLFQPLILAIIILDVLFDSIFNSFLVLSVAVENVRPALLLMASSRVFRFISALLLIFLGTKSLLLFSLVRLGCTLIMVTIAWRMARPQIGGLHLLTFVDLFKAALPYSTSDFLTLVYAQSDIVLLSLLVGNRGVIGNFSVVISLMNAILAIPYGIYGIWLPKIIHQRSAKRSRFLTSILELYGSLSGIGIAIWLSLTLFGREITALALGDAYTTTGLLLAMISPIFIIKCLNQANTALLIAGDLQKERLLPQLVSVLVKIMVGIAIIPVFQAVGMVWLGIFSEFVLLAGYSYKMFRQRRGILSSRPAERGAA